MDSNSLTIISITVPMVLGFIGVIFSVVSSSNASNHRIDDFRSDVYRRFDEVDKHFTEVDRRFDEVDKHFTEVDRRFDEVGQQIAEIKANVKEQNTEIGILSNRLNTYIDNFAVRLMTDRRPRAAKKLAAGKS